MKNKNRFTFAALGILALFLSTTNAAYATHFQGGNMSYSINASGLITVTAETLWRKGTSPFPFAGIGSMTVYDANRIAKATVPVNLTSSTTFTDTSDPNFDFRRQRFTISLPGYNLGQGAYIISFASCCRIGAINNVGETSFSLENKVIYNGTANASPQLNSSFITTVARGYEYSQNINAVDPDSNSMSYQFLNGATSPNYGPSSAIPSLTIDVTGQLKIPATQTSLLTLGNWVFKVQVTDASGAYSQRDVMVNVINTSNIPPVVGAIGNRTIAIGQLLNLSVSATDSNAGNQVSLTTSQLPTGATFSQTTGNPAKGTFAWTPVAGQEGVYTINFEAKDNGLPPLTDSEPITITVVGQNAAPMLNTLGNQTVSAGGTLNFGVTCQDANPRDILTLSASFLPTGANFTVDAFNTANGIFSWTPSTVQANQVFTGLAFRCTDNGLPNLADEEIISISVGNANQAPTLQPIGDQSLVIGQTLSIPLSASDADAVNTVTLSSSSLPANAVFSQTSGNPASGTFTFTPTLAQAGQVLSMTFTATDNGNPNLSSSTTINITITANRPPVANAGPDQSVEQQYPAGSTVTLNGLWSSDPDGDALSYVWTGPFGTSTSANPTVTMAAGINVVTLVVSDGKGGLASDSVVITVRDTTPPVVTVPAHITAEATGSAGSIVTYTASANDRVDGALVATCAPASGSTFAISTSTVSCSATDAAGNSGSASFSVTVQDTTPPVIAAHANVTAEATSAAGAGVSYTSPSTTDAVDGAGMATCLPASGSAFVLGNTTVTCNATDAHGNAATTTSFVVHVADTTPPVVTVPANIVTEATGATGRMVTFTSSASDLVDGALATTCTPASGSTFAIGSAIVTCTATDAASNSSSASFSVTVQDTTAPVIAAHADVTAEATSAAGAVVSYLNPSTTDAVDGAGVATCAPASGSAFALGNSTVTCSTSDARGNVATPTTFVVHVRDTTAPVIAAHANITVEATGAAGAVVNYSQTTATDAVSTPTVSCSPPSGSLFSLGMTTVTCTATDAAGNNSSASFSVTVRDTTPPVLTVPANMSVDATSPTGAVVTYLATATDSVSAYPAVSCAPASGSAFLTGVTTVICTATDAALNSTMASFTVTVRTPAQMIANLALLVEQIAATNAVQGIANSLDAKLQSALAALAALKANSISTACNKLGAFINEVQAQSGKSITVAQANQLSAAASQIRISLGCL